MFPRYSAVITSVCVFLFFPIVNIAQDTFPTPIPFARSHSPAMLQPFDAEESLADSQEEDESEEDEPENAEAVLKELDEKLDKLKTESSELVLQNFLQAEKHKKALQELQQEKERLQLENDLQAEKNRRDLFKLSVEKERLSLEQELESIKRAQALAHLTAEKERLELESIVNEQRQKLTFAEVEMERARLAMQNGLLEERNKQQELQIQLETARLGFEAAKLEFEKAKRASEIEELGNQIMERSQRQEWESQVNTPQKYLADPYVDGRLFISDRRIYLNEPIFPGVANYVTERIHYFNNKNVEYPIFLIIDACPGGSVMEGIKILKAMQTSRAPVYVLVKSLAASMAADIVALAKRSFAYPDAVIVHHQVLGFTFGNMTQQGEQLALTKMWMKRVMQPVADKMGITLAEFVEQMYKHNSEGDWVEFADAAVKLKWVDVIVTDVVDTSYINQPDGEQSDTDILRRIFSTREKIDNMGAAYVDLPRLGPMDFYYLYNPNNYYRLH